jgi:hypothetical protein
MRKFSVVFVAGVVAMTLLLAGSTRAEEKEKKKVDLPAKVKASLDERFPGAELTGAEKEMEDGNVVYDLELKHKGRKYEMDVKEDGTIMEIEKEVKGKDVPAAVTKAVEAKYPKAAVKEVMEVNVVKGKDEKPDHYEVTISIEGEKKGKEVIVALDGSSVKEEAPEAPEPKEKK